jgi:hypothetical protein
MSRFIRFEDEGQEHEGRPVYGVVNKRSRTTIGQVFWYGPWKRYTARFREDSVWSPDCLEAVATFAERKTQEAAREV